jgi:cell division transport system permease protein
VTLLARAAARALAQIRSSAGLHLMAALAMALTCFLAGAFALFLSNLDQHLRQRQGHAQFQIYWRPGADIARVKIQWEALRSMPGVDRLAVFTPEQALEDLRRTLGTGTDFSFLGAANPLPPTALVSFRVESGDMAGASAFLDAVKSMPGVDKVRISPMQLDMAAALRNLSVTALVPLSASLSLAVALLAYLAARLSLASRRDEVEIMRLVGADEWFVRLPWAISAGLTGLAGALAGLVCLDSARLMLSEALDAAPLWIRLSPLPWEEGAAMAAMALGMSMLGGWLAARP